MKFPLLHSRTGMWAIIFSGLFLLASCAGDQQPPPPLTYSGENPRIQNPLSPEESRLHIQLPEGFSVRLFASEPEIINPITFTWDERGRLWVVQSQDYPHELENEVGGDRITICEDTDGDGVADKFTDFATEQHLTTGITLVKGGAIVAQAPNMVFLEDSDGDDKMDKSTVLFDGFGIWDTHAGPSNLKYGIDNKIWGSVGYSGFEHTFAGQPVSFKMGVYRFDKNGSFLEPVGQFNNNTWGLGFNENFEVFGSTANNNHACYVGIPLKHYNYLEKMPSWAMNADFIQGHYEISPVDTVPLQQVDVRGGYTAASGANFYTARNYPKEYQHQMYVCEPTGHLVHIARIERDGAGYKEVDGGNIFASTDAWTAPVYAETGPDGNIWVADWYNPVIQHNPDSRGMDNQVWNTDKGEGNAHINPLRDYKHGRIYIIEYDRSRNSGFKSLDPEDDQALLSALSSDNMFWRTTAQRLIVEGMKTSLVPDLIALVENAIDNQDQPAYGAAHALWTLEGLNVLNEANPKALNALHNALSHQSFTVQRAALEILPSTRESSDLVARSGLLTDEDPQVRLAAILKAGQLPETAALYAEMDKVANESDNLDDKWLNAAIKVYFRAENEEYVDPEMVEMVLPAGADGNTPWRYTTSDPGDNWYNPGFNDNEWNRGTGRFGAGGIDDIKTEWNTSDIWMRVDFTLSELLDDPVLKIAHDEDYEVYINGQLAYSETGYNANYRYIKFDDDGAEAFQKGMNTVAVHCVNKTGDQIIDVGIGKMARIKTDKTFILKAVNQEMAYDKKVIHAEAGQTIEIVLQNTDQMPHNVVLIKPGTLEAFGGLVDEFLTSPRAAEMNYVPASKYVLGSTLMLEPGENGSIVVTLPETPGIYPYVCTFPGHWRMMQGVLIVTAPGSYISENKDALVVAAMGGGGSHDFEKYFGIVDGEILSEDGANTVLYTEDLPTLRSWLPTADVFFLTNNQPFDHETKSLIFNQVNSGEMNLMIYHPGTWYNWSDWPEYNKELVGGGSRSHEALQEFEVEVVNPEHPIMNGVPLKFRIVDELYRWEQDPEADIEVLAIGRGLQSGEEFPVVWTVNHPTAKIVCNTLGHDERAHGLKAYQTILGNSLDWVK